MKKVGYWPQLREEDEGFMCSAVSLEKRFEKGKGGGTKWGGSGKLADESALRALPVLHGALSQSPKYRLLLASPSMPICVALLPEAQPHMLFFPLTLHQQPLFSTVTFPAVGRRNVIILVIRHACQ